MPPRIGPATSSMLILISSTLPQQCEQHKFSLSWIKDCLLFCQCKNNYLFSLLNTLLSMAMQYPQITERRKGAITTSQPHTVRKIQIIFYYIKYC